MQQLHKELMQVTQQIRVLYEPDDGTEQAQSTAPYSGVNLKPDDSKNQSISQLELSQPVSSCHRLSGEKKSSPISSASTCQQPQTKLPVVALAWDEKGNPIVEHAEEKVMGSIAANWQSKYFERAKTCLETAIRSAVVQEDNFKRFTLYLGPPIYQIKFWQYEQWLLQQLEKSRAEDEHALWDDVHNVISKTPSQLRHGQFIGVYYGKFLSSMKLVHKQWKEDRLKAYKGHVIEPIIQRLALTGHAADKT